jgi:bacteriocin biosynthesis cyclodehydratase domain-containing protein
MTIKYYLSPGLEVIALDSLQLSLNLYGKRFTLKDESGLMNVLITSAGEGLDKAVFLQKFDGRFVVDTVDKAIHSLLDAQIFVDTDLRSTGNGTGEFFCHLANRAGKMSLSNPLGGKPSAWRVALIGSGHLARQIGASMVEHGVTVETYADLSTIKTQDDHILLAVVCSDNEDHTFFRNINSQAVDAGITSIYLSLDWQLARCGPLVIPKATACYECYFHRVCSTRRFQAEFSAKAMAANVQYSPIPNKLTIQWAVALATTQILSYFSGIIGDLHLSPIREVDVIRAEVDHSHLLKLPRCPVCGSASAKRPLSPVINSMLAAAKA